MWRGLQAPFPWFGGGARAARILWRALRHHRERFAACLPALLKPSGRQGHHEPRRWDWRARGADAEPAAHPDWPVTESDFREWTQ